MQQPTLAELESKKRRTKVRRFFYDMIIALRSL
jgi:hypothetical protein